MPNRIINRGDAEALIPEQVTNEIVQGAVRQSTVLSQFRRLPNMASNKMSMPVLDLLPLAYFVNGDTGMKGVTKMMWDKKYIYAEEIAVIVPIPEAVLDDAEDNGYDIWGEVLPRIQEAFGRVIDGAVIFGVNKPPQWRADLYSSIKNAGKAVTATGDLFADIMGENGVIAKVEEAGFMPNGVISGIRLRSKLRGLRTADGIPLFKSDMQGSTPYSLDGMPQHFSNNGTWDNEKTEMIVGDMSQAVYSIRSDLKYKILTEGVIQDPLTGEILFNLAQQDMVALRVVMRIGWEIPNPINAEGGLLRFPFACLEPATPVTTKDVEFTVLNSKTANPIIDAKVQLGGQTKYTNASGKAIFKVLPDTVMNYTVTKTGIKALDGTVAVHNADVDVDLTATPTKVKVPKVVGLTAFYTNGETLDLDMDTKKLTVPAGYVTSKVEIQMSTEVAVVGTPKAKIKVGGSTSNYGPLTVKEGNATIVVCTPTGDGPTVAGVDAELSAEAGVVQSYIGIENNAFKFDMIVPSE